MLWLIDWLTDWSVVWMIVDMLMRSCWHNTHCLQWWVAAAGAVCQQEQAVRWRIVRQCDWTDRPRCQGNTAWSRDVGTALHPGFLCHHRPHTHVQCVRLSIDQSIKFHSREQVHRLLLSLPLTEFWQCVEAERDRHIVTITANRVWLVNNANISDLV